MVTVGGRRTLGIFTVHSASLLAHAPDGRSVPFSLYQGDSIKEKRAHLYRSNLKVHRLLYAILN